MPIVIKDNIMSDIGGDMIRVEGPLGSLNLEISGNRGERIGGQAINLVDWQAVRHKFPEISAVTDADLEHAKRTVLGKSRDAAVKALKGLPGFTTVVTADWTALLVTLGWAEP